MLDTDDFRLPAIKNYLNLGFVPVYVGENHGERWRIIFKKLGCSPWCNYIEISPILL